MNTPKKLPGKILIAGSSGQLAKAFIRRFDICGQDYLAPQESELDITDPDAVARVLKSAPPAVVINCAAYNAVDAAESDSDTAFQVNADAVGRLATLCDEAGCRFVHYSSDYVFDGTANALYSEQDAPGPLNTYGRSKLAGERLALAHGEALVLRVSWVFGDGRQNFLHKLRQWSSGAEFVKVTADETSVPCYAEDIVTLTMKALELGLTGLFHATNSGYASRYEWAKCFLERAAPNVLAIPVSLSAFPSPAQRPHFTAMDNTTLLRALAIDIPHWRDAVERYLEVS